MGDGAEGKRGVKRNVTMCPGDSDGSSMLVVQPTHYPGGNARGVQGKEYLCRRDRMFLNITFP